ncbi:MAG: TetR/AcrR family transcriptional regulator [Anaerolineae bacterium]|nr:TetR/AcrR family transcriptional regulator [Anaerolineae bacterium]
MMEHSADDTLDVRDRILHAAVRLFAARGYHGVSMREIADACGISKAALYYHFQDKQALFLDILNGNLRIMIDLIDSIDQPGRKTEVVLRALGDAIISLPAEQRAVIRLGSQEVSNLEDGAREQFTEIYHLHFISRIAKIIAAGISSGEFRPVEPQIAAWVWLGMMYPFLYAGGEHITMAPEKAGQIFAIFFDGIKKGG